MKYQIISSDDVYKFEAVIERALAQGWLLQGGVTMGGRHSTTYIQAMVKG